MSVFRDQCDQGRVRGDSTLIHGYPVFSLYFDATDAIADYPHTLNFSNFCSSWSLQLAP